MPTNRTTLVVHTLPKVRLWDCNPTSAQTCSLIDGRIMAAPTEISHMCLDRSFDTDPPAKARRFSVAHGRASSTPVSVTLIEPRPNRAPTTRRTPSRPAGTRGGAGPADGPILARLISGCGTMPASHGTSTPGRLPDGVHSLLAWRMDFSLDLLHPSAEGVLATAHAPSPHPSRDGCVDFAHNVETPSRNGRADPRAISIHGPVPAGRRRERRAPGPVHRIHILAPSQMIDPPP